MSSPISIDELADAAGLTRRAVRFYVQQKLLPSPLGVGRGKHYDQTHLERLRRIQELQTAGYSLDEIRRLLAGQEVPQPARTTRSARRARAADAAELWTRIRVAEGIELHLDMKRYQLDVSQVLAAREMLRAAFGLTVAETDDDAPQRDEGADRPQ